MKLSKNCKFFSNSIEKIQCQLYKIHKHKEKYEYK